MATEPTGGATGASGVDRALGAQRSYEAVFTDKKDNSSLQASDFLKLMIVQMTNQDFLNPMDDTQFLTQMAQFTTMQQMTELAEYSKTNYAMSLVGKTVTASRFNASGNLDTTTGMVKRISLVDNEYILYIEAQPEDKRYTLSQVMEISVGAAEAPATDNTAGTGNTTGGAKVDPSGIRLEAGESTSNTAVVFWGAPTSDAAVASQLKYSVYYGAEGPFDTLALVKEGTLSGQADLRNTLYATVPGLEPGTQYYINVVVKDVDGVERVYKPITVATRLNDGTAGTANPPAAEPPETEPPETEPPETEVPETEPPDTEPTESVDPDTIPPPWLAP